MKDALAAQLLTLEQLVHQRIEPSLAETQAAHVPASQSNIEDLEVQTDTSWEDLEAPGRDEFTSANVPSG